MKISIQNSFRKIQAEFEGEIFISKKNSKIIELELGPSENFRKISKNFRARLESQKIFSGKKNFGSSQSPKKCHFLNFQKFQFSPWCAPYNGKNRVFKKTSKNAVFFENFTFWPDVRHIREKMTFFFGPKMTFFLKNRIFRPDVRHITGKTSFSKNGKNDPDFGPKIDLGSIQKIPMKIKEIA